MVRKELSFEEHTAAMDLAISLTMRDYAGFERRVRSGGKISANEMEEKYLPSQSDYDRVRDWMLEQGLTLIWTDPNHTTLFLRGSVDQVATALQVDFARVATTAGEFTSAVSAPSLPDDIAKPILNINGLEQHISGRPSPVRAQAIAFIQGFATPDDVLAAYNVPASANGQGQTIAVYGWGAVNSTDLGTYWKTVGSAQSTANVAILNPSLASTSANDVIQIMLDVEWAGAIAPAAKLRVYTQSNPGSITSLLLAAAQVVSDAKTDSSISVFSASWGSLETLFATANLSTGSQIFGQLAAAGITTVVPSGDEGSNPRTDNSIGYSASAPLGVNYPASDPFVTSVGGTSLGFDANGVKTGEVVWNDFALGRPYASGGGYSSFFTKPYWQSGGGSSLLASSTARCVPDIATSALWGAGNSGFFSIINGNSSGVFGTSLSTPIFAGIAAAINQARATAGQSKIGLLNPWLYALAGSSAFNAITSGNNGAYTAGPIYNLCTGLGSPNTANLISILTGPGSALTNLSVRTNLGSGKTLTVGFVTSGPKNMLIRAVGPGLNTVFGLTGFYPDPRFSVTKSGATIDQNDDWSSTLTPLFDSLGAFRLVTGSKDAALSRSINGPTTAEVSGSGAGIMLVEVYDAQPGTAGSRLTNVSARNQVGTGADIVVSGFVIAGTLPRPVLIRGIGPALRDVFGVSGVLEDPILEVHQTINNKDTVIASNDNWDSGLIPVFDRVGAYRFKDGSKDAALSIALPPGVYTAQISGANGTTGDGVVEVYEVP